MSWTYRLVSDARGVDPIEDLGEPVRAVTGPVGGSTFETFTFPTDLGFDFPPFEGAVGVRCQIQRTDGDLTEVRGGAVERVTPIVVALDGRGWRPAD